MTKAEKQAYNLWYRATFPEKQRFYDSKRDYSKKRPTPRDPAKQQASEQLRKVVKAGKSQKPLACVECQIMAPLEGHHDDYGKPLDVLWLCRDCHSKRHRKYALKTEFSA